MGSSASVKGSLTFCWCFLMLLPWSAVAEICQKVKLTVPSEVIYSGSLIGKVDLQHCLTSDYLVVRSSNPQFVVYNDGSVYAERKISIPDKISFAIFLVDISTMTEKKLPVKVVTKTKNVKTRYTRELLKRTKRRWRPLPFSVMESYVGPFPHFVQQIQSDTQENYTILYSITGQGVNQPPFNLFYIEETTGNIYITQRVDREEYPFFNLMGYAKTKDGYSQEMPLDILIKVEDDNDNAPIFTEAAFCMGVYEHSNQGVIVGRVNASDIDEPNSRHTLLRYTLLSQIPPSPIMFAVNPEYGIITTTTNRLDREVLDTYVLIIEVRDMGGQPFGLSSTGTASITVLDINDNAPEFTQQSYQVEVNENESGMVILRIPVTDKDLVNSPNWRAVYTITQGNQKGYFNITTDPATNEGLLSVIKGLNYEEENRVVIQVGVTNEVSLITSSGTKSNSMNTVPVTVIVKDVDEGPEFQPIIKTIRVRENQTIGTVIGDFIAIDPETKNSAGIRYRVEDRLSWVTIGESNGQITTLKVLDYETNEVTNHQHNVTVYAVDQSGKTGTGTLIIILEDINDNAPLLVRTASNICQTGRTYSVIEAQDPDGAPNSAPFRFTLDPSVANQWTIVDADGQSARIQPKGDLALGTYEIPVVVVDQQGHGRTQTVTVSKCDCADGINCSNRFSDRWAALGGLAILLMVLAALLLAALMCCLLACKCGSGAGKGKLGFPDDAAQQNLIVTNTEAPGADVMDPNFKVPVHIANPNTCGLAPSTSGGFVQGGQSSSEMGGQQTIQKTRGLTTESSRVGTMHGYRTQDQNRLTYSEWQNFMGSHIGDKLYMCGQDEEHQNGEDYVLPYNYEGKGSLAGSVGCCSELRGEDERLDFLNQLEPKFRTLAEVCAKK
ncbi:desmocollin-3-like [Spea bombifrons]|uniref:desmocollin-3-like n=1 Tax=Spea bombifrons TaxID=233779 RepID=UPI00234A6A47|nr:desmocollin-3-like [Spea bombifrons]